MPNHTTMLLGLLLVLLTLQQQQHSVVANGCGGVSGVYICNPVNPTRFDICIGEHKYTMSCPGGLHFNSRTKICDWPKNADCGKTRGGGGGGVPRPSISRNPSPRRQGYRDISSQKQGYQSPSSKRQGYRDPMSQKQGYRDAMPQKQGYRDPTLAKQGYRDPMPQKQGYRDPTSQKQRYRDPTSQKQGYRDPSPQKQRYRDPSPQKQGYRDPSPQKQRYRDPMPPKQRGQDSARAFSTRQGEADDRGHFDPVTTRPVTIRNVGQDDVRQDLGNGGHDRSLDSMILKPSRSQNRPRATTHDDLNQHTDETDHNSITRLQEGINNRRNRLLGKLQGSGQKIYRYRDTLRKRHREDTLRQRPQDVQATDERRADDGYTRYSGKASRKVRTFSSRKQRWWERKDAPKSDDKANAIDSERIARYLDDNNGNNNENDKTNNNVYTNNDDDYNNAKINSADNHRPDNNVGLSDDPNDGYEDGDNDRFSLAHYPWWAAKSASSRALQRRFPPPTPHSPRPRPRSRPSPQRRRQFPVSSAAASGPQRAGLAPSYPPVGAARSRSLGQGEGRVSRQKPLTAVKTLTAPAAESAPKSKKKKKKARKTGKCSPKTCQLPACRCVGTDIPGSLPAKDTPQMVMLTFDDSVNVGNFDYYTQIFQSSQLRNPNGCPIKGTFFVSGDATQYHMVDKLHKRGHEIASHSLSHRSPTTYWAKAGYEGYVKEIEGMRTKLADKCRIPRQDIKGMRVPFLQVGGDDQYRMLEDYDYLYDTSMVTGHLYRNDNPPMWPFTLDYPPDSKTCSLTPCPTDSYPGLWEVPLVRWYGTNRLACAMPDGCTVGPGKRGTKNFLEQNFQRHYGTNRAPLGIFLHASWFRRKDGNLQGLMEFLGNVTQRKDVWVVTVSQALDWVQHPLPNSQAGSLASWGCDDKDELVS